jgi:asparagine synthase (glutamine-hydrolysing)
VCGIAGVVSTIDLSDIKILDILEKAHETRGPDGSGSFQSLSDGTYFFQKRLAIIGQEIYAHQPITSWDGLATLNFNGEIYNWQELAEKFGQDSGRILKSGSDARLLVEGLNRFGVDDFLQTVRGMFAFAYLKEGKLTIVRDRFGQKPLKYSSQKDMFVFGSEIGTITDSLKSLGRSCTLNVKAMQHFIGTGYFPPGQTSMLEVHDLLPGHLIELSLGDKFLTLPKSRTWVKTNFTGNVLPIESALTLAIKEQLIADVPVGLFMSGGIDSSLIAAISKAEFDFSGPVITMGFPERNSLDETSAAQSIARKLDLELISYQMTGREALMTLKDMIRLRVEPLGDPSILPTMFLSKCMSSLCKVVLTGDGADETFFGYDRYLEMNLMHFDGKTNFSVLTTREKIRKLFRNVSLKLRRVNKSSFFLDYFERQFPIDGWENLFQNPAITKDNVIDLWKCSLNESGLESLRVQDFKSYLPQNILVKTDRSTMAYSLEGRMPFLDERVNNSGIQRNFKQITQKNIGKYELKRILAQRYLGDELVFKQKRGFSPPIDLWLKNELRPWAETSIRLTDWSQVGIESSKLIEYWDDFLAGRNNYAWRIWVILQAARALSIP